MTTVVVANCGYALAPLGDAAAREYLVRAMSTVEQIPEAAILDAVPFNWNNLRTYFDELDRLPVLINHAHLIGHVPLRAAVLGVPGVYERRATATEIDAMAALLREGLELGGLGFSTDQVVGNIGPGGSALPGQICSEEELLRMADVLAQGPGPGLFTMANAALLQGRAEKIFDLAWHEDLARRSGRPVIVGPVMDSPNEPGAALALLDLTLKRRAPGVTVIPQISTRPFELWGRIDSPSVLVRCLPSLAKTLRSGGAEGVRKLANDPQAREKLRTEGVRMIASLVFSGRWEHVFIRYTLQDGEWHRSVDDIARERGVNPTDLLLDTALADNFETQVATLMRNADDEQLAKLVSHPAAMIGASDAGAHRASLRLKLATLLKC